MNFQYLKWDESLAAALQNFSNLMNLFNFLLLQASGDVDKVLEWMKYLQRRGFIDERFDLEQFREQLEHQAIIQRDGESYSLTARGEQQIRKESLKLVFNNLKRGGFGQHRTRTPATVASACRRRANTGSATRSPRSTPSPPSTTRSNAAGWTRSSSASRTSRCSRPSTPPPAPRCC